MTAENAQYISELDPTNPPGSAQASTSDDHHRVTKGAVKNTLPNLSGPMVRTHEELNNVYFAGGNEPPVAAVTTPPPTTQLFATPGQFTWNRPNSNVAYIVVETQGAGGGGAGDKSGSNGGAGGGGGYAKRIINDPPATATIDIGAGGAGGPGGSGDTSGSPGGLSSYDDGTVQVIGNGGGAGLQDDVGGAGGTATGGDFNHPGQTAGGANRTGGGSLLGHGGSGHGTKRLVPIRGGGGGGASADNNDGDAGANGLVMITEFYKIGS